MERAVKWWIVLERSVADLALPLRVRSHMRKMNTDTLNTYDKSETEFRL